VEACEQRDYEDAAKYLVWTAAWAGIGKATGAGHNL
jgi:hypothetical protein